MPPINENLRTSMERVNYDVEKVIQMYEEVSYPDIAMMMEITGNAKINYQQKRVFKNILNHPPFLKIFIHSLIALITTLCTFL